MAHDAYSVALICISGYFLGTVLSNIIYLRRATVAPRITHGPLVSVIVPARNEEHSIRTCLESLLAQDYAEFEVIVVDDESTDATARIVTELAHLNTRLRLVSGKPLPDGWLGKPHALSQGAAVAVGEILILTDADTVHQPHSISWAVTNLDEHKAQFLSGYLNQEYGTFGESMTVPVLYAMMMLMPFYLIPHTNSARFAFAIGQFVAVRRDALDRVGGFDAISNVITDDMSMAVRMKEFGLTTVFLDAKRIASCRMYRGYRDAFRGLKRTIYSAVGGRPLMVFAIAATVLAFIVWPAALVLASNARLELPAGVAALAAGLFLTQWTLVAWDRNVPLLAVVLYPLIFLHLALLSVASMLGTGFGFGVDWKGRVVRMPKGPGVAQDTRPAER